MEKQILIESLSIYIDRVRSIDQIIVKANELTPVTFLEGTLADMISVIPVMICGSQDYFDVIIDDFVEHYQDKRYDSSEIAEYLVRNWSDRVKKSLSHV
jgi:hypothetical protein